MIKRYFGHIFLITHLILLILIGKFGRSTLDILLRYMRLSNESNSYIFVVVFSMFLISIGLYILFLLYGKKIDNAKAFAQLMFLSICLGLGFLWFSIAIRAL